MDGAVAETGKVNKDFGEPLCLLFEPHRRLTALKLRVSATLLEAEMKKRLFAAALLLRSVV